MVEIYNGLHKNISRVYMILFENIEVVHKICCNELREPKNFFQDYDFLPGFLDDVVVRYIRRGGNREGFEYSCGVNLYSYMDCMHDISLELFKQCQKKFEDTTEITSEYLTERIYQALLLVQRNTRLRKENENVMDDMVRDYLSGVFHVSDQARIGSSQSGNDAGNVDLCIWKNEIPLTIIEGIKLECVRKNQIIEHIDKLMLNYDLYGCKQLYLLIYYVGQNFSDFWAKLAKVSFEHLQERFGSVISIKNPVDINLNNSDIILFDVTLNGRRVELYLVGAMI